MAVSDWSTTAASNVLATTGVNFDEGQTPGSVNNSARELMAQLRTYFDLREAVDTAGLKGHLYGLTLSNNGTDATNDIDIAVGSAIDSTNAKFMTLGSGITKRLDASWAVGTGNGGLDTGSIANTTYHMWLIMRSDTGVVDVLFSASAGSPTMPTNYDYKRRIGSILREGGAIVAFTQNGDEFLRSIPIQDIGINTPGTSAVLRTLSVPLGVKVNALLNIQAIDTSGGATGLLMTAPDMADTTPTVNLCDLRLAGTASDPNNTFMNIRTNTSAQVRSRFSASAASLNLIIHTKGWVDTRGRLA
jgi:hypothetical protein